jgi:hypothetical protein
MKKIKLENYCYKLLQLNKMSNIFNEIDKNLFIIDIQNTKLKNNLTIEKINKLKKITLENNNFYIIGSFLTDILFSSFDNIYIKNPIHFSNLNLIQSILQDDIKERILFDGYTIYFTLKWYNLYNNKKLQNYSFINLYDDILNDISYQYYLIYHFNKKNLLNNIIKINNNSNNYDIYIIDEIYLLKYFFKHMDLSDDSHIKYIIYLFIIKPNLLFDIYNEKNILYILLEEYNLKKEYINNYNKIIAYIHTLNPILFISNIIKFTKNEYEMYVFMQYILYGK